jgi:hypothetical protein
VSALVIWENPLLCLNLAPKAVSIEQFFCFNDFYLFLSTVSAIFKMTSRVRPERKGYDVIIYQQHVDRLRKMSPTVDAGPPREHPLSNKREMDKVNLLSIAFSTFQLPCCSFLLFLVVL